MVVLTCNPSSWQGGRGKGIRNPRSFSSIQIVQKILGLNKTLLKIPQIKTKTKTESFAFFQELEDLVQFQNRLADLSPLKNSITELSTIVTHSGCFVIQLYLQQAMPFGNLQKQLLMAHITLILFRVLAYIQKEYQIFL